jgi:hypothetical protein
MIPDAGEHSYGDDHTFGTGNSYLEDPMQGIEDVQEAADGDDDTGGFTNPDAYFVGDSDPDGDGDPEFTVGGHLVGGNDQDSDSRPAGRQRVLAQLESDGDTATLAVAAVVVAGAIVWRSR